MAIPAHWMLAASGATMHLLLDLLLAFADVETHRVVRGFNGRESHCIRAAQLVFVFWLRVVAVKRFASM